MAVNGRSTDSNFDTVRLDKPNAVSFSVDVSNAYALYQLNVPQFGRGENWMPAEGRDIGPGYWTFDRDDFAEYGVDKANGIRFKSKTGTAAVISAS